MSQIISAIINQYLVRYFTSLQQSKQDFVISTIKTNFIIHQIVLECHMISDYSNV